MQRDEIRERRNRAPEKNPRQAVVFAINPMRDRR
jgi:hypothetical protein